MNKNNNILKNNIIVKKLGAQRAIVSLIIIALIVVFSLASPAFRRYSTFVSIADYSYNIALMAIGVTFVLISGGVDLSIGTGIICYAIAGGYLVKYQNMPVIVGMLVTVLFGLAIGLVNGILVAVMKLPPFLATLCTMMITRGLGTISASGFGIPWPPASAEGGWFRSIFKLDVGG
ncbi:MAG: ABC transporter permease, partial [Clostridiales bacterium]|nr:ABC transporter permease [Clostridiales bacterium]